MHGQEKMEKKKQFHRDLSSDGKDLWKKNTDTSKEKASARRKERMDLAKPKQNKVPYKQNNTITIIMISHTQEKGPLF